jgi:competence protein ComEC
VWIADPTKDIDLGDGVTLDVIWPPPTLLGRDMKDVNNSSIVARVLYGSDAVLLGGDAEEKEERDVLASGADIRATVLKAGHHGSKTSSGTGFLLAVDPDTVAISCGRDNSYGHPHQVILDRFRALGIPARVTAWEGDIEETW